jgi:hypothetical protein
MVSDYGLTWLYLVGFVVTQALAFVFAAHALVMIFGHR